MVDADALWAAPAFLRRAGTVNVSPLECPRIVKNGQGIFSKGMDQ